MRLSEGYRTTEMRGRCAVSQGMHPHQLSKTATTTATVIMPYRFVGFISFISSFLSIVLKLAFTHSASHSKPVNAL